MLNSPLIAIDPDGKRVYFVISFSSVNSDYWAAALTREREIKSSKEFDAKKDHVYVINLWTDKRLLKTIVEEKILDANKNGYGETVELDTYGHGGTDGPVIGENATGTDDVSKTYGNPIDLGQLNPDGWSKINFNFDPNNSIAAFYGCKTEEFAQRFVLFTKVKYSAGLSMEAGVSDSNEEYDASYVEFEGDNVWEWDGNPINVYQRGTQMEISYTSENGGTSESIYGPVTGKVDMVGSFKPNVTVNDGKPVQAEATIVMPLIPNYCFVGGTQILLHNGKQSNIEDLKIGDTIMSYDLISSKVSISKILKADMSYSNEVFSLEFSDGTINRNTIGHPYYVKNKGWCSVEPDKFNYLNLKVNKLEVGDVCYRILDGILTEVIVKNITKEFGGARIYNISVEDTHNFFANNMLVHNKDILDEEK